MNEMSEEPRYKVVAQNGAMLMSGYHMPKDSEVKWISWPTVDLDAVNEPARRVQSFWQRHNTDATIVGRYAVPTSSLTGKISLTSGVAISMRERRPHDVVSERIWDIPKPVALFPGMPVYKLKAAEAWHGGEIIAKGAPVVFVGWPRDSVLAPASAEAVRVCDWFVENRDHPKFDDVRSPWNEYTRSVELPELPELQAGHRSEYAAR